jgi:hypothetical protein
VLTEGLVAGGGSGYSGAWGGHRLGGEPLDHGAVVDVAVVDGVSTLHSDEVRRLASANQLKEVDVGPLVRQVHNLGVTIAEGKCLAVGDGSCGNEPVGDPDPVDGQASREGLHDGGCDLALGVRGVGVGEVDRHQPRGVLEDTDECVRDPDPLVLGDELHESIDVRPEVEPDLVAVGDAGERLVQPYRGDALLVGDEIVGRQALSEDRLEVVPVDHQDGVLLTAHLDDLPDGQVSNGLVSNIFDNQLGHNDPPM